MLRLTRPRVAGLSGVALGVLLALPGVVFAGASGTIAQTGGMSAKLPILGASLAVDITLDGSGNLSQLNLDPVGSYTATKLGSHAVTFDTADGVTRVKIRASGDKLSIKASTASLGDLVGSGTWSADVFGTKEKSSVGYSIGKASDGSPTVYIDLVSPAPGITPTTVPMTTKASKNGSTARAGVDFASNGFVKHLVIKVSVRSDDTHAASLGITLSGKDRQEFAGTLADIAGDHTWSGALCDGTPVSATFNVATDGTVTFVSATGASATSKSLPAGSNEHGSFGEGDKHGADAATSTFVSGAAAKLTGTRAKVSAVVMKLADGSHVLAISGKGGACHSSRGTPPKVNTPVSPNAAQADKDGKPAGNANGSGNGHGHGRGHGRHGAGH